MRAGDVEFEARYDEMLRFAYRAAYRLLGQRVIAEDVAAEARARAYARWGSVAGHADAWVITVATNLALDIGRRHARSAPSRWQLVEETASDPQTEVRLDLQQALRSLPRRQREVLALRYLGDFTQQATADALGLDVGTVKSHTSRGLSRLRTQMDRV